MNRICITGNICAEPTVRTTQNGKKNVQLRVAVRRPVAGDEADFFSVTAWGQTADYVEQYAHKGSRVEVDGRINFREYTARDGSQRVACEITADRVELPRMGAARADAGEFQEVEDSELPF